MISFVFIRSEFIFTGNFILNGVKSWVTNAVNADIFIVWAHLRSLKNPAYESDDIGTLSAFIVDIKESSGINVNKEDLYSVPGLKGCGITNVEFNNVCIHNIRHNFWEISIFKKKIFNSLCFTCFLVQTLFLKYFDYKP